MPTSPMSAQARAKQGVDPVVAYVDDVHPCRLGDRLGADLHPSSAGEAPGTPRSTISTAVIAWSAMITSSARGVHTSSCFQRPRERSPTQVRQDVFSTPLAMMIDAIAGVHIPTPITQLYSGWMTPTARNQNGSVNRANRA